MYDCVHTLVLIDFCSRNNFRHSCENGELRRYSLTQTLPSSPLKLAQPSGHLAIYVMTLIFGVVRSCWNYTGAVRTGLGVQVSTRLFDDQRTRILLTQGERSSNSANRM